MTYLEKVFSLNGVYPFNLLSEAELFLVAEIAQERVFQPGERLFLPDKPASWLFICIDGFFTWCRADDVCVRLPGVLGIKSLLFDLPCEKTLLAGPDGARCLAISREHFFTIMYECPQLAPGFLEIIQKAEFEQLESVS